MVAKFTQIRLTPFKDGILGYSWWYWFTHRHLKLTIQLVKGLEVYKAQGLTSESYNSFYRNLQTLYDQHKYLVINIENSYEIGF